MNVLQLSATDSSSTATFTSWTAKGLPTGLALNSGTGAITGVPGTAGIYTVVATATDNAGYQGTCTFFWVITATSTVTVSNPGYLGSSSGAAIAPLSLKVTDSSTTSTITSWSAKGLPAGLGINSGTGAITGVPTTAGSYSVVVTATDDNGYKGNVTFSWTVTNAVIVTNPEAQTSTKGATINPLVLSATDSSSTAIINWSATGLPSGLSINGSTGVISGKPNTAGTYKVVITATDNAGYQGKVTFTWTIQ
jgi:hypothetical protein